MGLSCDLFCRVVDNLGDAGVCWRLARQLAHEYGWQMRLWIDDLTPLARLRPGIDPRLSMQHIDSVEIRLWTPDFPAALPTQEVAQVVIEAFACELPPTYIAAMAAQDRKPVWINLEYLSAEDWVPGCHGLPSPHPTLPLKKHFFFPGFDAGTGGLLREANLCPDKNESAHDELLVTLFCYDNPALPELLGLWAEGAERIHCAVADGLPRQQLERWLGRPFSVGQTLTRGSLRVTAAPFLPQSNFDVWLARADLNFVRGEDSFVRAQWAERAFAWQAYPQQDAAHFDKIDAFLARYTRHLSAADANTVCAFWRAWNGRGRIDETWPAFRAVLPRLTFCGQHWAEEIASHGHLAENLVRFCLDRL